MNSKHEFALYMPFLREIFLRQNQIITLDDPHLAMRLTTILRLEPGEQFILFDELIHVRSQLIQATKKNVQCKVLAKENNVQLKPSITLVLPILKKEDFENTLYAAVELGANVIQLITTQKIQRSWHGDKELERCKKIMSAAAEQSKNFALPQIFLPETISFYLSRITQLSVPKIYFDVDGENSLKIIQELSHQKPKELILMVGPEGDLTAQEKELLKSHNFTFCALTPTVLRSVTAVQLGLGMYRATLK